MCLVAILQNAHPRYPLILLGNRDEFHQRPSVAADWWPVENGVEARNWAEAGYLVIGGLKAAGHGHVVVVTSGPLAHGKYPTAYWGHLGSVGAKAKTINYSWNATVRDKVRYFAAKPQA